MPFSSFFQAASSNSQAPAQFHGHLLVRAGLEAIPDGLYIHRNQLVEEDVLEAFNCKNECLGELVKWMAPFPITNLDSNTLVKSFKAKNCTLHSSQRIIVGSCYFNFRKAAREG
jgi:hypothetical protein